MWYQNDGCPAHFASPVREYLNQEYPERWIGRHGPILWPPTVLFLLKLSQRDSLRKIHCKIGRASAKNHSGCGSYQWQKTCTANKAFALHYPLSVPDEPCDRRDYWWYFFPAESHAERLRAARLPADICSYE
ncbi:hypothetical protein ACJJTC_017660 [Scirpophaga incertulas]